MFALNAFMIYVIVTAITPGPNNILSMSMAGRYGLKKSLPFNLGIWLGFSIVILLCTMFSALLYNLIPRPKPYMLALGAAYMLYLAYKIWTSGANIGEKDGGKASFLAGMLLQFVNPKGMIYGITSMSVYILPYFQAPMILIGFALMLSTVGFLCTLCWSAFGAVFKKLMAGHAKWINGIMALLLVYCAVSLFFG